nr:unnamed protein product [Spirometra erinaceieuropaei]
MINPLEILSQLALPIKYPEETRDLKLIENKEKLGTSPSPESPPNVCPELLNHLRVQVNFVPEQISIRLVDLKVVCHFRRMAIGTLTVILFDCSLWCLAPRTLIDFTAAVTDYLTV